MKAAKPNLARSAPALGLNCADWASKTASGRPRRSDGRSGRSAGQSGLGRVGTSWPDVMTVGRRGRTDEIWPMVSRPDAGVLPGSDGTFGVVRETSCAAARRYFPARARGRARRGVALWRGRPRA
ncbi:unnamed protein product [Microthlaspi erraticum]|uniref:Uncharacterized protein n=1 Tax=Microthlaspi erraticum TaxID=1685480 RepID=A0A6D2L373_9BRAS|nr:unnamed protein product [Microthlaspi erraticum]